MLPENAYSAFGALSNLRASRNFLGNKTYKLLIGENENRISGFAVQKEAAKQSVYKILNTERFRYPIYSTDYGVQIADLLGKDRDYIRAELERRIIEALIWDERILSVENFDFDLGKSFIRAKFTVRSIYGDFEESTGINNV